MTADFRIEVWDGCAAEVAMAVETFCDRWERHSTKSLSHSIFNLFEELIDQAFASYLSALPEHHGGRRIFPNISLTKLARLGSFGLAEEVIHATLLKFMEDVGRYDFEFERTLETLLVAARRCGSKRPKRLPSGRSNRLYSEYCDFCGANTELSADEKGDFRLGYDREGAARLSGKYCRRHRPKFLDGSRNPEYLWVTRHKQEFEIELERLSLQAKALNKPNGETGDPDLDLFYFQLLKPLAIFQSDISFLRNEARRIVDLRVTDKKKRIVVMRTGRYTLDTIAKRVNAKSRQTIAKALATVPKRYRFDVANDTTRHRDIDNLEFFADRVQVAKAGSSAQAHFMELVGPAAVIAIRDPDIREIMLNDDGSLWSDSVSTGMKRIDFISAFDATKIVQFAVQNFNSEKPTGKDIILLELPFANARFTAFLPPIVERPVFGIRKGG